MVVDSAPEVQIERAVKRGMQREDAVRRSERQMKADVRRGEANYVIENNGDIRALEAATLGVYEKLRADLQEKKKSAAGTPAAPPIKRSKR